MPGFKTILLWLLAAFWLGVIYYFGRAGFGRANTQVIIDRVKHHPRIWHFLDRHHGKIRASFHYFEFGLCYAILYLGFTLGKMEWYYGRGFLAWFLTGFLAFLDEMHQKKSGGRCFRKVDLLHSILGGSLAMIFFYIFG